MRPGRIWYDPPHVRWGRVAVTVLIALLITLAAGAFIGISHAILMDRIGLPPFITTLASMAGLRSVSTILSENRSINVSFSTFRWLGKEWENSVVVFAVVSLIFSAIMGLTVAGRHLYAMGGNEQAARLSGIRTDRLKWLAYCLGAMTASIAGVLYTAEVGIADPVTQGRGYELNAIAASVV